MQRVQTFLMLYFAFLVTGCVSQNPPIVGIPIDANAPEKQVNSQVTTPTSTLAAPANEKFLGIFTPYRITIQQGNFVSKEMVEQVKEGMTREQVRFLLGTALLTDMFHADRWDYIFRLSKPNGELIASHVTVHFHQSLVASIERDDLPSEKEYLMRISDATIK